MCHFWGNLPAALSIPVMKSATGVVVGVTEKFRPRARSFSVLDKGLPFKFFTTLSLSNPLV